jgi:hypothetical protein
VESNEEEDSAQIRLLILAPKAKGWGFLMRFLLAGLFNAILPEPTLRTFCSAS